MTTDPRPMGTVLATVMFEPDEIEQLRRAASPAEFVHLHPADAEGLAAVLPRTEVAILPFEPDLGFLDAPELRWVHCDQAGLNRLARPEVFEHDLIVTGSAGRSAPALAQHAFYFALALAFDARGLFRLQDEHRWGGLAGHGDQRALWGKTLGIVGLGHTGTAMAELGKAFGMRVAGFRRSRAPGPASVDQLLCADAGDSLHELLAVSDVVMLAAPLTDETHHLFGSEAFAAMKPGAVLVNMARGPLVDHDALLDALRSGAIAGAGLDVTEPEPLPADSPLWDLSNVVITPHVTPKLADRTQRSIDIIVDNLGRYRRGEPLRNALTARDVYSKGEAAP